MATTSQRGSNGVKHRCGCFSSATTSILYGLRREAPPTERSTLERLLNVLSRGAHTDSRNPQRIWSQEPEWWRECTPLPWKNPREHPKDRKEVLQAKVEILQTQLRSRGLLTSELEEEWRLYKSSNKIDMERKSDFEAIIAKSSGLHHMLDRVREKVNGAFSVNDKIAGYICQIKACLERSLGEVRAMYSFVEEKERGKKKLWDQMGVLRPAKRLRIFNDEYLTLSSVVGNDDESLSLSPVSPEFLNLDPDLLPYPTTGHDAVNYPSLEALAKRAIAVPLCSDLTLNSASPLTDSEETEEETSVRHQPGCTSSATATTSDVQDPAHRSDLDSSIKGTAVTAGVPLSPDAAQKENPTRPTSTGNRAEPPFAVFPVESKTSETFKCDILHTLTNPPIVTLTAPATSTHIPMTSASKDVISTNTPLATSSTPLISSHMSIMSSSVNLSHSYISSSYSDTIFPSSAVPFVSSLKPLSATSSVRCKSDPGFPPKHLAHLSAVHLQFQPVQIASGTTMLKHLSKSTPSSRSSDLTGRAANHAPSRPSADKKPAARHCDDSSLASSAKAPPTDCLKTADSETELAVSSILLSESSVQEKEEDDDEVIVADDEILKEVEEIIEESPAPTVRMYVTGDGDYELESSATTDCEGHVSFEDILPSVEGVIMAGLSERDTGGAATLGGNSCTLGGQTSVPQVARLSPNALSLDIGRLVVP